MIARGGGVQPGGPVRARTGRHRVRRAIVAFLSTAAVGALLWFINVLQFDLPTALLVAVLIGVVLTLLTWVMAEESPRLKAAYWFASMREESVRPGALDYRMLRLRRDLRDATERSDRTDEVYPVIRQLTAEKLLAVHDIDLSADPAAAEAVLPPDLAAYLAKPPTGTSRRSKRDIHRALDRIEDM